MMKKYCSLLLILISSHTFAQFKLNGKINHYSGNAALKINIPLIYGFDEANSKTIPVSKDGTFTINIPVKAEKFADLIFQQNFHLLLLTPGKSLKIELNQTDRSFKLVAGNATPENTVLQTVNIEEYPFFLQNDEAYTSLSPAELDSKLVKPYFATLDRKIAMVNKSVISPKHKKLITAELKYSIYNNIHELVVLLGGQYADKLNKLVLSIFAKVDAKPEAMPAGPQYYLFANNYLWYKETKATQTIRSQNLKPNQLIPDYGITVAEKDAYIAKYGSVYLRWLSATKFLPAPVIEQLGYLYITNAVKNNNALLAKTIAGEYLKKFPAGVYKKEIGKKLATLK